MKTPVPQWIVTSEEQGLRLDRFLAVPGRLRSRGRVRTALERGQVFLNDVEASARDAGSRLTSGDVVRVWIDRPGSGRRKGTFEAGGLKILYEDETLLVVNKPAGLLTVPLGRGLSAAIATGKPSTSVFSLLADHLGPRRRRTPFVVHRIDRDTSGVVLFALTARARGALVKQFAERTPERVYLALVDGHPHPSMGTWHDRLSWDEAACRQRAARPDDRDAVDALSDYRVVEAFASTSLLEVRLTTGRQGQIRVQAQLRGHPLVGDRRYGGRGPASRDPIAFDRQALHALQLAFAHPIDRRRIEVTAPPPADLSKLLAQLRHRR